MRVCFKETHHHFHQSLERGMMMMMMVVVVDVKHLVEGLYMM